ncbi:lantibiotic dehydratase [Streptomyces sp. NPDC002144]
MYHVVDAIMIRASVLPLAAPLPPWPAPADGSTTGTDEWREWIIQVWADDTLAAAIEFAAPLLADAVRKVLSGERQRPRTLQRTAASLARYLLRSSSPHESSRTVSPGSSGTTSPGQSPRTGITSRRRQTRTDRLTSNLVAPGQGIAPD